MAVESQSRTELFFVSPEWIPGSPQPRFNSRLITLHVKCQNSSGFQLKGSGGKCCFRIHTCAHHMFLGVLVAAEPFSHIVGDMIYMHELYIVEIGISNISRQTNYTI